MQTSNSVICTVFEGHYHKGVVALANSLYQRGFRGTLYAGYRGELPDWASPLEALNEREHLFQVAQGFRIHFGKLDTKEMLANVKPELMQQAWKVYGHEVDNLFYIDCDIVIKSKWHHFEDWAELGVALCEDINSPMPATHPVRLQWKRYYAKHGIDYEPKSDYYVNGGFVGLNRKYLDFAELWQRTQNLMKLHSPSQDRIGIANRWHMFHYMDQDALNVAKDLTPSTSILAKHAMDFGWFGEVMSHAAGPRKPWQENFLLKITTKAIKPSFTEKIYWEFVDDPIRLYSPGKLKRKRLALRLALFLGRFYTRT